MHEALTGDPATLHRRRVTNSPKWRRRAEERPQEIAAAALAVFADRGYASARLTDIAAKARGLEGRALPVLPTKADLFEAVLLQNLAPRVGVVAMIADADPPSLATIERLLAAVAETLSAPSVGKLARIVIAESGNFPEIARAWREAVVAPALGALQHAIEGGQRAGSLRDGDPRLMAMTVVGPLLLGAIWREVIEPVGGEPPRYGRAGQGARTHPGSRLGQLVDALT